MPEKVIFSIIVSLYNKDKYIAETINSVIKQSCKDWELIIVDNNSDDHGYEICKDFSERDNRISVYSFTKSQGPGATRNFGFKKSKGKWVLYLDADDLIEDKYLESRLKYISHNEDAEIIVGGWKRFKELSNLGKPEFAIFLTHEELTNYSIAFAPWIIHSAIIKRNLLTQRGWVEELDLCSAEDVAFWFSLIVNANVKYVTTSDALYRIHEKSRNSPDLNKWINDVIFVTEFNKKQALLKEQMNSGQYEYIYRLYEGLLCKALVSGIKHDKLLILAKESLQKSRKTLPILVRKIVSIELFVKIKIMLF